MGKQIELLDCTLRDGAYITNGNFGTSAIRGIIYNLQETGAELIECGWLKNEAYTEGSTYYHLPSDLEPYLIRKKQDATYLAMIDYNRYDTEQLPPYDGKSIDAIRIVFPHGKLQEGIEIGEKIREKGYKVYYQAANTLSYTNEDLLELAGEMNAFIPEALSIVDTFGAMYEDDLDRIVDVLDAALYPDIRLGFHSHNNQQLAFALSMHFVNRMMQGRRGCIADATLCGMGRGAGNTTTELMVSYLNRKYAGGYDMNVLMDTIDKYMQEFSAKYKWGYSTPYFIAGMYQCHVNNIAYLLNSHRTNTRDMRNIIESLSQQERRAYDYDLLEEKYMENQSRHVEDGETIDQLRKELSGKKILLLCPGHSLLDKQAEVLKYFDRNRPVVIGVGAVLPDYRYDYAFFANHARYEYAMEAYPSESAGITKLLLSNIKTKPDEKERIINFDSVVKRGWTYFDNAAICCLRLLARIGVADVAIAGFDGFLSHYNESYADRSLPTVEAEDYTLLNREIGEMYRDFVASYGEKMRIEFVTESPFA